MELTDEHNHILIKKGPVKRYCLGNTRGINLKPRCYDDYIRITLDEYNKGLRVSASTIGFIDTEQKTVRVSNVYRFGHYEITMIWRNIMRIPKNATSVGKLIVQPNLIKIYITHQGTLVNAKLPCEQISNLIRDMNEFLGQKYFIVTYLGIDFLEMLKDAGYIQKPDLILEKIMNFACTKSKASIADLKGKRMIPDDMRMTLTVENSGELVY